jgi:hypothetical protein
MSHSQLNLDVGFETKLVGSHKAVSQVTDGELAGYFEIFRRYYDHVTCEQFKKDFRAKDYVILLRQASTNLIRGFSTVQVYEKVIQNKRIRVVFSGDTIIERDFWGQQELPRTWCHLAGRSLLAFDVKGPPHLSLSFNFLS